MNKPVESEELVFDANLPTDLGVSAIGTAPPIDGPGSLSGPLDLIGDVLTGNPADMPPIGGAGMPIAALDADHRGAPPQAQAPNRDDTLGKMFVGGLSWETTQESLREYFSQFGDISDCVVMKDPNNGRSRGFGFVTFADPRACDAVLSSGPHKLDERTIDPKKAVPRQADHRSHRGGRGGHHYQGGRESNQQVGKTKKIFVGGLPPESTEQNLEQFFSQYGHVEEVILMYDRETKRPRGFGFVTFTDEQVVDDLVATHFHNFLDKTVEVKRAEPKPSGDRRGGYRGRGGYQQYRGGYGQAYPQDFRGYPFQGYGGNNFGGGYEYHPQAAYGAYAGRGAFYQGGYNNGYNQQGGGYEGYQEFNNGPPAGFSPEFQAEQPFPGGEYSGGAPGYFDPRQAGYQQQGQPGQQFGGYPGEGYPEFSGEGGMLPQQQQQPPAQQQQPPFEGQSIPAADGLGLPPDQFPAPY